MFLKTANMGVWLGEAKASMSIFAASLRLFADKQNSHSVGTGIWSAEVLLFNKKNYFYSVTLG